MFPNAWFRCRYIVLCPMCGALCVHVMLSFITIYLLMNFENLFLLHFILRYETHQRSLNNPNSFVFEMLLFILLCQLVVVYYIQCQCAIIYNIYVCIFMRKHCKFSDFGPKDERKSKFPSITTFIGIRSIGSEELNGTINLCEHK